MECLIGSKLNNILNGKVNLDRPNVEFTTRIGSLVKYNNKNVSYMSDGAVQFVLGTCDNKNWCIGEGPAIPVFQEDYELDFETAINKFAEKITQFANGAPIKFNLPVLPMGGVEMCILEIYENLVIRYIRDYLPGSDLIATRFDVVLIREV